MKTILFAALCMTGCCPSAVSIAHFGGSSNHDMYRVGPCNKLPMSIECSRLSHKVCPDGYQIIGTHSSSRVIMCYNEGE